ncbi:MAG: SOS response-associated peptidase [Candidatus Cloacimonetes bacterium]|nr:SOS response-associated peptidase [Candidatus Cloacimonadota bacterium]
MCGRFALFSNIKVILEYADLIDSDIEWSPHYNISPSMMIPVLIKNSKTPVIDLQKWGLIPNFSYSTDKEKNAFSVINAKSETITTKPMFKNSFKYRRCLIPANGFYEWRKSDRQPFFIRVKDLPLIFFAGIWNSPKVENHTMPNNFTIITANANEKLQPIHNRMPVIFRPEQIHAWLFNSNQTELIEMLKSFPEEDMIIEPVSREVNYSRMDHPGLIEKIETL